MSLVITAIYSGLKTETVGLRNPPLPLKVLTVNGELRPTILLLSKYFFPNRPLCIQLIVYFQQGINTVSEQV